MKRAGAFFELNTQQKLQKPARKMEQTLRQRCIPADHKGLFAMLRRGERLFRCRQIFVNGGCGSASFGNGPDY